MTEYINVILDEIKFHFTYKEHEYMAHVDLIDKIENDQYLCKITGTDDRGSIKDIDIFYFDSCGGTTEYISDIAQEVLNILFDDNGIIRGF